MKLVFVQPFPLHPDYVFFSSVDESCGAIQKF